MQRTKHFVGRRLWLLAAIAGVTALVGLLPMFGDTAYAAGVNYNNSASLVQFRIPGGPATRVTADFSGVTQCSVGTPCTLTVSSTAAFPSTCPPATTCQILVVDGAWGDGDKNGAEIMTYNGMTATTFNIIERGPDKVGGTPKKAHSGTLPNRSLVKLATVLTTGITASDGPQTRMTDGDLSGAATNITAIAGGCTLVAGETFATCPVDLPSPFMIQLTSTAGFPASGHVAIGHQDVQTANQSGVGPGQSGESMQYDTTGVGANQIRIIRRAQQSTNRAYPHLATGFLQPGQNTAPTPAGGPPGVTKVSVHFQAVVKSNVNFFPSGNLLVCNAGNPLTNCELLGYNNAAAKIKVPASNEFHVTDRCADASTFNKAPNDGSGNCTFPAHAANTTIVTGADNFILCRVGAQQPGVDTDLGTAGYTEPATQVENTSVGNTAVCYTESQPKEGGPPKPQTIVGQDLIVFNSIAGQPFLSTGGLCHVALGPVGRTSPPPSCPGTPPLPFDNDGPNGDADDCDADGNTAETVLCLGSPCIPDFTPGTNLLVISAINVDKTLIGLDSGSVRVVTDTVHDNVDGNADDCDQEAASDTFTFDTYDSSVGEPAIDKGDDTDRDGCVDEKELRSILNQGGLRDPWNPYDWYDINHDGAVTAGVDVLQVAQSFGVPANYSPRKDRGAVNYGPFAWNKSGPNNNINSGGDVLGVSQQFSSPCLHDSNTMTPTHEGYDTGLAWPAGNRPWYCQAVTFLCGSGVPPHGVANHGP